MLTLSMADLPPDRVRQAQNDDQYLNEFIRENEHFIKVTAFHAINRFVSKSDDEWSVALIAFHEAVKSYDSSKGDFKAFASLVIKRRLTDYLISQSRRREVPLEPEVLAGETPGEETATALQLEVQSKMAALSDSGEVASYVSGAVCVRDEIEAVQAILPLYGFSFFDLAECSPKKEKTKKACADAAAVLLRSPELFKKMQETRALPMKELQTLCRVPRKLLERHRRYLIAAAEILHGDYPLLSEYLDYIRKALKDT